MHVHESPYSSVVRDPDWSVCMCMSSQAGSILDGSQKNVFFSLVLQAA